MLAERSDRGDPGASCWCRCRDAFERGCVDVEHAFPCVHEPRVMPADGVRLPEVRVE